MDAQTQELIIRIIVGVAVTLITGYLIPAITTWLSNSKNTKLKALIDNAVDAAEQIYGPKTAEQKKAYVLEMIQKAFPKLKITENIDMLIEASVCRVSAAIKQSKEVLAAASVKEPETNISDSTTATQRANGLIVAKEEESTFKSAGDKTITLS